MSIALAGAGLICALGCGSSANLPSDKVVAVVEGLHEDMAAGDFKGVCAALTDKPKSQIGSVGHGRTPTNCVADLRRLVRSAHENPSILATIKPPPSLEKARRPTITSVAVRGRRAVAHLQLNGEPLAVPFKREGGRWKLDDFFVVTGPVRSDLQ